MFTKDTHGQIPSLLSASYDEKEKRTIALSL